MCNIFAISGAIIVAGLVTTAIIYGIAEIVERTKEIKPPEDGGDESEG